MDLFLCVSWKRVQCSGNTTQISKLEGCVVLRSKVTDMLFKQSVGVFSGHVEVEPILANSANFKDNIKTSYIYSVNKYFWS